MALAAMVIAFLTACNDAEDLEVGQLSATGSQVSMVLVNTGALTGPIGLWIVQDGIRKCEHFIRASANTRYSFTFRCNSLTPGRFEVLYGWASRNNDAQRAVSVGRQITF